MLHWYSSSVDRMQNATLSGSLRGERNKGIFRNILVFQIFQSAIDCLSFKNAHAKLLQRFNDGLILTHS